RLEKNWLNSTYQLVRPKSNHTFSIILVFVECLSICYVSLQGSRPFHPYR
ncbi:hypothetical protein M405DRAFT_835206, partial [Rhizopogon salebrosus TDB-379]